MSDSELCIKRPIFTESVEDENSENRTLTERL